MSDSELARRIEELSHDYEALSGRPWEHFYCPILRIDEVTDICKGHVVPKAFRCCSAWVPQRKDVDNFFGTIAEAAFVDVVSDRKKDVLSIWLDRDLANRHRPRIESEGKPLDCYFPKQFKAIPGQTRFKLVDENDVHLCDVVVKLTEGESTALLNKQVELVVDRDYRPAVIASLLKAAHLTLFKMFGYRHVFSLCGSFVADILREFFESSNDKSRNEIEHALGGFFRQFESMIVPLVADDGFLGGTAVDGRILACVGSTKGFFAIGITVKAGSDKFCVFLPNDDGSTIDTYFSFVRERPQSIAVKIMEFRPASGGVGSHWATNNEDPTRIAFS
jgi:hypothetical protein